MKTIQAAVDALMQLDPRDYEKAHAEADRILLEYLDYQAPQVSAAYRMLQNAAKNWPTA